MPSCFVHFVGALGALPDISEQKALPSGPQFVGFVQVLSFRQLWFFLSLPDDVLTKAL